MDNLNPEEAYHFRAGEVLLVDKPLEWTSFDVVNKLRNHIRKRYGVKKFKVGHAGTLDPLATGLLIICAGRQTKKIEGFMGQEKEYVATMKLGATTPSYDSETPEEAHFPVDHIDRKKIEEAAQQFVGDLEQLPPIFSAKKISGKRAHHMAREGKEVKMRPHFVTVHSIEVLDVRMPEVDIKVVCGKGTYIRSLAYDIGKALNSGAYLTSLRRTRIGDFRVEDAKSVEEWAQIIDTCKIVEDN